MTRRPVPSVALLDVNVLVALFDPEHVHHDAAHDWFADHRTRGWATCAITENGFLRVLTASASARARMPTAAVVRHLQTFCASGHHEFWPEIVSLTDDRLFERSLVRGHKQVTDIYLLGLAVARGGRLVTFDRGVPLGAVNGARPDALVVLAHDGV
jgi:uncharacterized protein